MKHGLAVACGLAVVVAAAMVGCGRQAAKSAGFEVVDKAYVQEHLGEAHIVDVRTEDEYGQGHIEGALNYDSATFDPDEFAQEGIGPDEPIILYCRSGMRAKRVAKTLVAEGYTNVSVYEPGYPDWAS